MIKLKCVVQDYAWGGKPGCLVDRLARCGDHFYLSEGNSAELWVGTHPSGPFMTDPPGIINEPLPFLLKVLSIDKPLSVQIHPKKDLAAILHTKYPDIYKDANHKAEIAIPLTEFEALGGLRSQSDIDNVILRFPELSSVRTFCDLINNIHSDDVVHEIIDRLLKSSTTHTDEEQLILRLHRNFPYDVGVLSPIYLVYHRLVPGEALFIPPGCPHAYLSGDIVECMTASDNVIRCGLTNKHIDTRNMMNALDEQSHCIVYDNRPQIYNILDEFQIMISDENDTWTIPEKSVVLSLTSGCAWYITRTDRYSLNGRVVVVSEKKGMNT